VELGQTAGSRTLRFQVDAEFDSTDTTAASDDQLLVYLIDPTDPTQTLLDRGEPGTAIFSLLKVVAIQRKISEILGCPVDLGSRTAVKPRLKPYIEPDLIDVF
jgi:hypothetical protein